MLKNCVAEKGTENSILPYTFCLLHRVTFLSARNFLPLKIFLELLHRVSAGLSLLPHRSTYNTCVIPVRVPSRLTTSPVNMRPRMEQNVHSKLLGFGPT